MTQRQRQSNRKIRQRLIIRRYLPSNGIQLQYVLAHVLAKVGRVDDGVDFESHAVLATPFANAKHASSNNMTKSIPSMFVELKLNYKKKFNRISRLVYLFKWFLFPWPRPISRLVSLSKLSHEMAKISTYSPILKKFYICIYFF